MGKTAHDLTVTFRAEFVKLSIRRIPTHKVETWFPSETCSFSSPSSFSFNWIKKYVKKNHICRSIYKAFFFFLKEGGGGLGVTSPRQPTVGARVFYFYFFLVFLFLSFLYNNSTWGERAKFPLVFGAPHSPFIIHPKIRLLPLHPLYPLYRDILTF